MKKEFGYSLEKDGSFVAIIGVEDAVEFIHQVCQLRWKDPVSVWSTTKGCSPATFHVFYKPNDSKDENTFRQLMQKLGGVYMGHA